MEHEPILPCKRVTGPSKILRNCRGLDIAATKNFHSKQSMNRKLLAGQKLVHGKFNPIRF